jgi:Family of unknown function (DUF5681)
MSFKKGLSGNPSGRPVGLTAATKIRKDIEKAWPDILKKIIEQAKGGDMAACKILLDKICPNLRSQALPITLAIDGGLVEQGNEIIKATMNGQIPPDIGSQLITALAHQSKIIEIEELTKRIEALEQKH